MIRNPFLINSLAVVILVLVIFFNLPAVPVQGKDRPTNPAHGSSFAEIDAYIDTQLKALNVPGASLAIVEGDRIVHTRGFGSTGRMGEIPTPQTPFFIGSLTKSFTALAVMQLVEAGKLDLDAPIKRYLPWFSLADTRTSERITVRHLLNQTSGISQMPGMLGLADFDSSPGAAERQARALRSEMPARPAGFGWEYSNVNFNLLGLIIEEASGEDYASYIENHIFHPLEMQHSYTSKSIARKDHLVVGHQQWFGVPVPVADMDVPVGSLASGQLIASAEDVARYLIAHLNRGRSQDAAVLSPQGMEQIHYPAVKISEDGHRQESYAMGWFVDEVDGERLIFHYGEVPDSFAYMALLPDHGRAIVLLVNTNEQLYTFALLALGESAVLRLAGIPARAEAWRILPWALRAVVILPILQIVVLVTALPRIRQLMADSNRRSASACFWLGDILLPVAIDLFLAAIAGAVLLSGLFQFLMLYLGDLTAVLLVCGTIALIDFTARAFILVRAFRKSADKPAPSVSRVG